MIRVIPLLSNIISHLFPSSSSSSSNRNTELLSVPNEESLPFYFFPAALMTLQPRVHNSYLWLSVWQPFISWHSWSTNESPMHTTSPIQSLDGHLLLSLSATEEPQWFFISFAKTTAILGILMTPFAREAAARRHTYWMRCASHMTPIQLSSAGYLKVSLFQWSH